MGSPTKSIPTTLRVERTAAWRLLIGQQAGAVSRAQLLQKGVGQSAIVAQIAGERLQHAVHGVYVTYTGPLTRDPRIAVALLYGEGKAVLSHRTAAEEWGM